MENLYSIEILIRNIMFYHRKDEMPKASTLNVKVTFGPNLNFPIQRDTTGEVLPGVPDENCLVKQNENGVTVMFHAGKSVVFAAKTEEFAATIVQHPIRIEICNLNNEYIKYGSCQIELSLENLKNVLSTKQDETKVYDLDETAFLKTDDDVKTGIIELFVRLSNLGEQITTQFQVINPDSQTSVHYAFKNHCLADAFGIEKFTSKQSKDNAMPNSLIAAADMITSKLKPIFITPFHERQSVMVSAFKMAVEDALREEKEDDEGKTKISNRLLRSDSSRLNTNFSLTPARIRKLLCGNSWCPVAVKFRDLGIGPFAPVKSGLGAVTGREIPSRTFGMSQMYGSMDNYGPYGLLKEKKDVCECIIEDSVKDQEESVESSEKAILFEGPCECRRDRDRVGECCLKEDLIGFIAGYVPPAQRHCHSKSCATKDPDEKKPCACTGIDAASSLTCNNSCNEACSPKRKPTKRNRGGMDRSRHNNNKQINSHPSDSQSSPNNNNLMKKAKLSIQHIKKTTYPRVKCRNNDILKTNKDNVDKQCFLKNFNKIPDDITNENDDPIDLSVCSFFQKFIPINLPKLKRLRAGMDAKQTNSDDEPPRLRAGANKANDTTCGGKKCYLQQQKRGCGSENCEFKSSAPAPTLCGADTCPMCNDDGKPKKHKPKLPTQDLFPKNTPEFVPFFLRPKPLPKCIYPERGPLPDLPGMGKPPDECSKPKTKKCCDNPACCRDDPDCTDEKQCWDRETGKPFYGKISHSYGVPVAIFQSDKPICLGGSQPCGQSVPVDDSTCKCESISDDADIPKCLGGKRLCAIHPTNQSCGCGGNEEMKPQTPIKRINRFKYDPDACCDSGCNFKQSDECCNCGFKDLERRQKGGGVIQNKNSSCGCASDDIQSGDISPPTSYKCCHPPVPGKNKPCLGCGGNIETVPPVYISAPITRIPDPSTKPPCDRCTFTGKKEFRPSKIYGKDLSKSPYESTYEPYRNYHDLAAPGDYGRQMLSSFGVSSSTRDDPFGLKSILTPSTCYPDGNSSQLSSPPFESPEVCNNPECPGTNLEKLFCTNQTCPDKLTQRSTSIKRTPSVCPGAAPKTPTKACGNSSCPFGDGDIINDDIRGDDYCPPCTDDCPLLDVHALADCTSPLLIAQRVTVQSCGHPICPMSDIKQLNDAFRKIAEKDVCEDPECPFYLPETPKLQCTCKLTGTCLCCQVGKNEYEDDDEVEMGKDMPRISYMSMTNSELQQLPLTQSLTNYLAVVSQIGPCNKRTCKKVKLPSCPECGGMTISGATCQNPNVAFDPQESMKKIVEQAEKDEEKERKRRERRERKKEDRLSKTENEKKKAEENQIEKERSKTTKLERKYKRTRFSYKNGKYYPGIRVGHKYCNAPVNSRVPSHMGWLWNLPLLGQSKKRSWWRPGYMNKVIQDRISARRAELGIPNPPELKMLQAKRKPKIRIYDETSESEDEVTQKPTLKIKKEKDGTYNITMYPLKNPKTLQPREDPYMNCTPMQFIIKPKKSLYKELSMGSSSSDSNKCGSQCTCKDKDDGLDSSSSESEMDIEFTPPAGLIYPEYLIRKPNVVHTDTIYNHKDITDPDLKVITIASKKPRKKMKPTKAF